MVILLGLIAWQLAARRVRRSRSWSGQPRRGRHAARRVACRPTSLSLARRDLCESPPGRPEYDRDQDAHPLPRRCPRFRRQSSARPKAGEGWGCRSSLSQGSDDPLDGSRGNALHGPDAAAVRQIDLDQPAHGIGDGMVHSHCDRTMSKDRAHRDRGCAARRWVVDLIWLTAEHSVASRQLDLGCSRAGPISCGSQRLAFSIRARVNG